ncbi:MAG: GxxExxY protein [Burkholderiaceae bacterium]|nr:GxxExxY protein [Sulfuritalea sp.]MCF8176451.1 GxxExxY protein [Burkholderiaceae bacterium]
MNHRDTETQRDPKTEKVIGAAIEVHRILGPGLLESAYEECLAFELGNVGFEVERQVALPVRYKSVDLNCGYRIDLLIDNCLIVELKTVESFLPIHEAQLLTYLRLSGITTGLLINFNVPALKNGLRRMKL